MPELNFSDAELLTLAKKVSGILNLKETPVSKGPRMRLLKDAYAKLKSEDPGTCVTETMVRKLVLDGKVKSVLVGQKRLINYDSLVSYFSSVHTEPEPAVESGKIRRIAE